MRIITVEKDNPADNSWLEIYDCGRVTIYTEFYDQKRLDQWDLATCYCPNYECYCDHLVTKVDWPGLVIGLEK